MDKIRWAVGGDTTEIVCLLDLLSYIPVPSSLTAATFEHISQSSTRRTSMVVLGRHSQVVGRVQRSRAGREELDLGKDIEPHGLVCLHRLRLLSGCTYLLNTDLLYSCCMRGTAWRRQWQPTPVFLPGESQRQEPSGLPSMGSHRVGHD